MTRATIHIALLRGVNVGGHRTVAMSDLRDLITDLGFSDARTLLQSGNLVFRGNGSGGAALEQLLETEAAKRLGLEADFLIRSAEEWKDVVARNPFPKEAERDPSHLVVVFLEGKLGIRGTARNWNTVLKLSALADECGERGR